MAIQFSNGERVISKFNCIHVVADSDNEGNLTLTCGWRYPASSFRHYVHILHSNLDSKLDACVYCACPAERVLGLRPDPALTWREEILKSMARTLYVVAVADAHDDSNSDFDAMDEAPNGGDWMDSVTSATPHEAYDEALRIALDFEDSNERTLDDAATQWAGLDGQYYHANAEEAFGHRLVMQALGSGVGLWDEADKVAGFEVPAAEFYLDMIS